MISSQKFYLYKRSNGFWYIGHIVEGRKRWTSAQTKNKNLALKALNDFKDKIVAANSSQTFDQFVKTYCDLQAHTIRQSTLKRIYLPAFRAFSSICENRLLTSYTVRDVEIFKKIRLEKCSPTTVNIDFRSLKAAFNVALKWQLINDNPFVKSTQLKIPSKLLIHLSKDDFQKLLHVVKEQVFKELFLFASLTGMRLGEILNLTWENVNFEKQLVTVTNSDNFATKSGNSRAVPMNSLIAKLLLQKISNKPISKYVFDNQGKRFHPNYVSHKFKKYIRLLKLDERLHFHSLRHTFATWLVQGGVNIYEVQKLLGHSSVKVTEIYSHLASSELHSSINKIQLELNP
ncbi:MAG: site-specific integrase [Ignavibacteriales bacterium]|nr:site-specific integrase [Ignavibacteriales bacterium]